MNNLNKFRRAVAPSKRMIESLTKASDEILQPIVLAAKAANRVPKVVKPLDLPDKLPEEAMHFPDVMKLFQNQFLTSYYGDEIPEDTDEQTLDQLLEANSVDNLNSEDPKSSMSTVLGNGLGSMVNNPNFVRTWNPLDTEFETTLWDNLAELFRLPLEFTYANGGLGIINGNESDGLLAVAMAAKFQRKQTLGDESSTSNEYIVYCSMRQPIFPIKRVTKVWDMTLKVYETQQELFSLIEEDKKNGLQPCLVIHDGKITDKETYLGETKMLSDELKSHDIWFHYNLGHNGWFAILDEFRHLTQVDCDSLAIEASRHFEMSYEGSLLWAKDRDRIKRGMNLSWFGEKKYQYASTSDSHIIDFKNYHVYLSKMNRAYKLWFTFNMYGLDELKKVLTKEATKLALLQKSATTSRLSPYIGEIVKEHGELNLPVKQSYF